MSKELHDKILSLPCLATQSKFATRHELNCFKDGHQSARQAAAALVLSAAAPQVVADERATALLASATALAHKWNADAVKGGFAGSEAGMELLEALDWPDAAPVQAQHSDDVAIDRFAATMKEKMAASRAKGRSGWDDPEQCSVENLAAMLCQHVEKGDPVDIANFAMMIHERHGSAIDVYEALAVFLNSRSIAAPVQPVAVPDGWFVIEADSMAAFRRFYECAMDGEGHDVPASIMKVLASIGLVQRRYDSYYETTDFGLAVLDGKFAAPAAQGDTITLTRDELVNHRNQAFEQGVCEGKDQAAQGDAGGLTDDEIEGLAVSCKARGSDEDILRFARTIIAAIAAKAAS